MGIFCIFGESCMGFDADSRTPAPSGPCNLCEPCENEFTLMMKSLVSDYIGLSRMIARANGFYDEKTARPKPASSPPIDLGVDELRSDMVRVVGIWEREVRTYVGLPPRPPGSVRQGYALHEGVKVLWPRVDLMAGLGPTLPTVHLARYRPVALSGKDALFCLRALHWRARSKIGLQPREYRLPGDCPGCSSPLLVRVDGEDLVRCSACTSVLTYVQYQRLVSLAVENFGDVP